MTRRKWHAEEEPGHMWHLEHADGRRWADDELQCPGERLLLDMDGELCIVNDQDIYGASYDDDMVVVFDG